VTESQGNELTVRRYAKAYYIAKKVVLEEGYADEVDWQYSASLDTLDEPTFLREAAWVILCSGMREKVVSDKFQAISRAFLDWASARHIVGNAASCERDALVHFGNVRKIGAITQVANMVSRLGIEEIVRNLRSQGVPYLERFPYIGPVTAFHLAKNIGVPCAKPDRHLASIADRLGYPDAHALCSEIAGVTDEPIPVVDIVLWRFATLHRTYLDRFLAAFHKSKG
jgi:hypothetical protein